jgi:hypothetical protein
MTAAAPEPHAREQFFSKRQVIVTLHAAEQAAARPIAEDAHPRRPQVIRHRPPNFHWRSLRHDQHLPAAVAVLFLRVARRPVCRVFRRQFAVYPINHPRLGRTDDSSHPLAVRVIYVMTRRAALHRLVHPVFAVKPAIARRVVGLIARRIISHPNAILSRQAIGCRVYGEAVARHSRLARRTTDRPIAPAVVTEVLREQVERPRAAAVLLRFGHGLDPVQAVIGVIIELRDDRPAAARNEGVEVAVTSPCAARLWELQSQYLG